MGSGERLMKKVTIGILAHVDAGKTTLIEQLLVASGKRPAAGRVDHGTAFLDTETEEKARGITISSKMCRICRGEQEFILMDTPGHVDFMAESERVLPVLDAAVLVIGAGERIPTHAQYLFRLLKERSIPTVIFFNKMDLPVPDPEKLLETATDQLGEGIVNWLEDPEQRAEEAAVLEEALLEQYLSQGMIREEQLIQLFHKGRLHPCCFGAALRGDGISELLELLMTLFSGPKPVDTGAPFGAYCYKILHGENGERQSFLKILSGSLNVRDSVLYHGRIPGGRKTEEQSEKITEIRAYDGSGFEVVRTAEPGDIVAVTGLSSTFAGCGLGVAPSRKPEVSRPMLRYHLNLPEEIDPKVFLPKLRQLEEEEDTLSVDWVEEREEIEVELYGEVQLEILTERIRDRFGIEAFFGEGTVVYRETLSAPSYGMGHFEPLRHYAEVHFLLEPMPRGTGILLESRLSTDELDRSWQQTILTAVEKENLTGVLTNSGLTDLKITLVAGRAHKKHTEGGDFREAALRAVRQGLMKGDSLLLEPFVAFTLTVPSASAGKALYDMNQLASESHIVEQTESQTTVEGRGAISGLRNYMSEVRMYTHGEGLFRMVYDGYDACPDQEQIVEKIGYRPESDLMHPAGSVFVSHGTADFVSWSESSDRMHLESRWDLYYPEDQDASGEGEYTGNTKRQHSLEERLQAIGTDEIDRILRQASHANETAEHRTERRNRWAGSDRKNRFESSGTGSEHRTNRSRAKTERKAYLLVDGYNIVHAWEETKDIVGMNLDAARAILLDLLTEYRSQINSEIIVVFDAYQVSGHRTEVLDHQNIHVVFTSEAETADQYIARFTTEHEKNYDITVATSDGMIQLIIRGADARVLSATDLHHDVMTKKEMLRENYLSEQEVSLQESFASFMKFNDAE